MSLRHVLTLAAGLCSAILAGCVTPPSYDYTAYRAARPQSILMLPPVNDSTSVIASNSVWSQMTLPLAEAGYYVFPITLIDETFRQNGLFNPAEVAQVPPAKLRQVFGADAALYTQITQYGTVYRLLGSASVVTAKARLVDLRSGATLWEGSASASSDENNGGGQGGLVGLLVTALVKQIIESSTDASHGIASITSARLLGAGRPNGILYGPRSPNYEKQ